MRRCKSLIIPIITGLCTVLTASFAIGQASSANYNLTGGGLVGGGGISASAANDITGTFGFGPMGVAISTSYILNGGLAAVFQPSDVFYAAYTRPGTDTVTVQNLTLKINFGYQSGVVSGKLYYQQRGSIYFDSAALTVGPGDTLRYTIPSTWLTARGLNYYFIVRDEGSGITRLITNGGEVYTFICELTNAQGQRPTALPEAKYRIVGIPVNHQGSRSVPTIFGDDLGAIDITQWRLGRHEYEGTSLVLHEYNVADPNIAEHLPGIGYWLAVRHGRRYGTDGFTVTPNRFLITGDYLELAVDSGWNQLANPFAFPIDWELVRFDDNGTVVSGHPAEVLDDAAYWYNGSEYETVDSIPAWEGFFVNIKKKNVKILFRHLIYSSLKNAPQKIAGPAGENDWRINLQLITETNRDIDNYAGVIRSAESGYDYLDFAEPPPPPGGTFLAFVLPEQKSLFRCDYRPVFKDGAEWQVKIAKAANRVLKVSDLNQLPPDMSAWLIFDNGTHILLDDRIEVRLHDNIESARLIIGTQKYISHEVSELLPKEFSLEQNFPNPFNPATSISFSLPEPGFVQLEVYNVLGQNVRALVEREMEAGKHIIDWDGKDDNGRAVASGVYFYRIQYNDLNACRKMVLLK